MARPVYLEDESVAPGSSEGTELAVAASAVEALAESWVGRLRALAQTRRGVAHLLARVGDRPPASDPEGLSFWVVSAGPGVVSIDSWFGPAMLPLRNRLDPL